jgi:uncharacterized membrane protein
MTPDWIPNIHPFIVHFPIALLVVAVLCDVIRVFTKKQAWLDNMVLALYAAGTVGLIAAFLSGRHAVDTVTVTGDAIPVVTAHEDWALYTMIYFFAFTLLRAWTWWKDLEVKRPLLIGLVVLALAGTGMLWYTGELGAKLVYKHGVAVGEIDRLEQQIEGLQQDLARFREDAAPVRHDDGSWTWRIGPGADHALTEYFTIEGSKPDKAGLTQVDGRHQLHLKAGEEASFLLFGDAIRNVDGRIELKTEDFQGEVALIHHFQDPENFQYLRLVDSEVSQGQILNGSDNVLGSGQVDSSGWFTLRVAASGRHFYGYHNGRTIVHTHADEMEPGRTGFLIRGEGTVKIRLVEFSSVE